MLTGQNGILTQANNANVQQSHAAVREGISLAYNEWQIELKTSSNTKIASTDVVTIQGKEEKTEAGTSTTFLDFLVSKNYVDGTTKIINVENLTGSKQSLGNGTGTDDVYKIEEDDSNYRVVYYENSTTTTEISTITKMDGEENPFSYTQADIDETLKYFTWETIDITEENKEYFGNDENMVGKKVTIITGTKEEYYVEGVGGTFPISKIVIPNTIDGSDLVVVECRLYCMDGIKTIIYNNDYGMFTGITSYGHGKEVENIKLPNLEEDINEVFSFTNLKNLKIDESNKCYSMEDNIVFNKNKTEITRYMNKEKDTYQIPEGIVSLAEDAFRGCTNLKTVNIPSSVTTIGEYAFSYCTNLKTINIPSSVNSIERGVFFECSSLTEIDIPSSVNSIGSAAFSGCSSLTSINIPSGVTRIEENTFEDCIALTELRIPNTVTDVYSSKYGGQPFNNCSNLTITVEAGSPLTIDDFENTGIDTSRVTFE